MRGVRAWIGWLRWYQAHWVRNDLTDSAASLAFYGLVSLAPLLLLAVGMAGLMLGERAAHGELTQRLADVMGTESADYVEQVLQGANLGRNGSPLATIVAVVVLAYSGTHVLHKLRITLNTINAVDASDPARRWLARLLARGLSGLFILLPGLLLAAGTLAKGFFSYFADHLEPSLVDRWQVLQLYDRVSTYLLLVVAFTFILKVLPRRRPKLAHAFAGAAFAAAAVCLLKGGLDFYLTRSWFGSVFGTGLAVLVFLLWFFLSVQAFLGGAQFAALLGERRREGASDG
jgi:membrane protein